MLEQIIRSDSTVFPISIASQKIHNFNQAISDLQQGFAVSHPENVDVQSLRDNLEKVHSFLRNEFGEEIAPQLNIPTLISAIKQVVSNVIAKAKISDSDANLVSKISEYLLSVLKYLAEHTSTLGISRDEISQIVQSVETATQPFIQRESGERSEVAQVTNGSEVPLDTQSQLEQTYPVLTYEGFNSFINGIQDGKEGFSQVETLINQGTPLTPLPGIEGKHALLLNAITNKNTDLALAKLLVENGAYIDEFMIDTARDFRGKDSPYVLALRQLLADQTQHAERNVAPQAPLKREENPLVEAKSTQSSTPEIKESARTSTQLKLPIAWIQAKQALLDSDYKKFSALLPKIGAYIAHTDEMGRNLFHYAALHGDSKTVNDLSKACIEQFNQEKDSHTYGSFGLRGKPPLGRFYEALSSPDQAGNSPLHLVIQNNRGERLAQTFITQGAPLKSPVNHLGQTPESLAKKDTRLSPFFDRMLRTKQIKYNLVKCDMKEALKLLKEENRLYRHGMSFDIWNRSDGTGHKRVNGANLLHFAVQYFANKDVIDAIIDKGVDVNYQDQEGETPLHYVVRTGNFFALTPLLKRGASLEIKNKTGETPLDLAGEEMRIHIQQAQGFVESSASINRSARFG